MLNYRANGKLLLTSEYAITQGAKGLAIPTTKGQSLRVDSQNSDDAIIWNPLPTMELLGFLPA